MYDFSEKLCTILSAEWGVQSENLQTPTSKLQRNTKLQIPKREALAVVLKRQGVGVLIFLNEAELC